MRTNLQNRALAVVAVTAALLMYPASGFALGLNTSVMTDTMNALLGVFRSGAGELSSAGAGLLGVLVAIEVTWAGIMWSLSSGDDVFRGFLRKVVHVGVFTFIVLNFSELANAALEGFMWAGGKIGGTGISVAALKNPSLLLDMGFSATKEAWLLVEETSIGDGLASAFLMAIVSLMALLLYFAIALQIFVTLIEFYIVASFGVIFIPWGVNRHTAFIAERYFGAIIAQGTKLMVLAALVGVLQPLLQTLALPPDPSFEQVMCLLFGVGTIAYVIKRAPEVAGGLMAGSASLSAGDAVGAALGAGGAAASVVGVAASGATAGGSAVAGGVASTAAAAGKVAVSGSGGGSGGSGASSASNVGKV